MMAPRSADGRAAGLPTGPKRAVVVGDRTDTEDVEPEAPLTGRVLDEHGAGAFVEALDLDLRDGRVGISPSTSSSNAEVEADALTHALKMRQQRMPVRHISKPSIS